MNIWLSLFILKQKVTFTYKGKFILEFKLFQYSYQCWQILKNQVYSIELTNFFLKKDIHYIANRQCAILKAIYWMDI